MDLMNYNYLIETEESTKAYTEKDRAYWFNKLPDLINSLFECNYFIKWDDNTDDENNFIIFANSTYQQLPYMFRVLEILYLNGFYFESTIIIRTIYEMFVKLRYFHKYKDKCLPYSQKKLKIQYKLMFDEFSPGLYEILYGMLLSEFAHGGFGVSIFRNKFSPPNMIEPILGNFYSESFANLTINACTQLIYGYLNYIPTFFNLYTETATPEIKVKMLENIKLREERINDQIRNHPKVAEFYDLLFPLIK